MIIYHIALVFHVVGIVVAAGGSLLDFLLFRQSSRQSDLDGGSVIEQLLERLQRVIGIGMALILLSGVVMMIYLHQVWGAQVWFRVKMGVLVLILVNQLGFRRRFNGKLKNLVARAADDHFTTRLAAIRRNITAVQVLQLLFFVSIFTLSVFKFN